MGDSRLSAPCHVARKTYGIKGKEGVSFQADLSPNKFIPVEHFSESRFPVEKCSAGTSSGQLWFLFYSGLERSGPNSSVP